jgi:hypothetical protein
LTLANFILYEIGGINLQLNSYIDKIAIVLIITSMFSGLFVIVLNKMSEGLLPYQIINYIVFLIFAYYYYNSRKRIIIPYFFLMFVVFMSLLIDAILPNGLVDKTNDVQNTSMIIFAIFTLITFLVATFKIKFKDKHLE